MEKQFFFFEDEDTDTVTGMQRGSKDGDASQFHSLFKFGVTRMARRKWNLEIVLDTSKLAKVKEGLRVGNTSVRGRRNGPM